MHLDEPPADALTALGRIAWAAIELESCVIDLCSLVKPVNPRTDRRPVSKQIEHAKAVLRCWTPSESRDAAISWLDRAAVAMDRRNAALHATPMVRFGLDRRPLGYALGEMPRAGRPYFSRPFEVDALTELRDVLSEAAAGWREIMLALDLALRADQVSAESGRVE
ncbi:hypothetical protein [Amycolatopsis thermoflava]|uniref:hypothetical protein n=1 Tax=Amycolatopsis thermoflava TaxID=84480 RepID=UPI003F4A19C1